MIKDIKVLKRKMDKGYILSENNGVITLTEVENLLGNDDFIFFKNNFNVSENTVFLCAFDEKEDAEKAAEYLLSYIIMNKLMGDDWLLSVQEFRFSRINERKEDVFSVITLNNKFLSLSYVSYILDTCEIFQYFKKIYPNVNEYSILYLFENKKIAEDALEFLEPYMVMRELIKWTNFLE